MVDPLDGRLQIRRFFYVLRFSVVLVAGDYGGSGYIYPFQNQVCEVVEQTPAGAAERSVWKVG